MFQSFKLTLNSVLQYYPNYVAEQKRFWIWEKEKDPIYAGEVKAVLEGWRVGELDNGSGEEECLRFELLGRCGVGESRHPARQSRIGCYHHHHHYLHYHFITIIIVIVIVIMIWSV